jgi:hypothetical protein
MGNAKRSHENGFSNHLKKESAMSHLAANSNRSSFRSAGCTIAALFLMTLLVGCGAEGSSPSDTTTTASTQPQEDEFADITSVQNGDLGQAPL